MRKLLDALVAIATALERQAVAQERIASALESQQQPETGDKALAAQVLGVSKRQVERYQGEWIQGIHYTYEGKRPTYNLALLRDWKVNRDNPMAHQRAIKNWQKGLLSGRKRA